MKLVLTLIAAVLTVGCVTPSGAKGGAGVGMRQAGVSTQSKADRAEFSGTVVFHGDVTMYGGSLAIGSNGGQSSAIADVYQEAGKAVEAMKGSASTAVTGQGTAESTGAPVDQSQQPAKQEPVPPATTLTDPRETENRALRKRLAELEYLQAPDPHSGPVESAEAAAAE